MSNIKTQEECPFCHKTIIFTERVKNLLRHYSRCKEYIKCMKENITKNYLENLYIKDGSSIIEIQEKIKNDFNFEIAYLKVKQLLEEYKIPLRNIYEANKMPNRNKRIKNTCIEKYGDINVLGKNSPIYEKRNQTVLEKYGVTNVFQAEKVKDKIKQTNLERYGYESAMTNKNVQEKLKNIFIKKYGTSMPMLMRKTSFITT